tara:strand:- start:437 stop:1618 length:1182 start_codon:yes stop_codon:yes gene_type:complete
MSYNRYLNKNINKTNIQICSRCIYDERVPGISFNNDFICNYCIQVESLKNNFGTGSKKGKEHFDQIINKIKKQGNNKKYDCVVGVSGGTDSSYLLYLAKKKWNLRPLAVHYDNTWNSSTATMNIKKVLQKLDIDLYTHVVNNKESDDIYRSFFLAGVPEFEASTDLGYAFLLRKVASKFKLNYVLEGHSFLEEGISPLGVNYFDGKYIESIHKKFGNIKLKTYPLMTFSKFISSIIFSQIKFIRPYWYINYKKKDAIKFLTKIFGWEYYGGHHLENRSASFYHTIYLPRKFNVDLRNNTISARVRKGDLSRAEGWREYNTPPKIPEDLLNFVLKRLSLNENEYEKIMKQKPKHWTDFPNYKSLFEFYKPLFYVLAKLEFVPMSFYLKYCFPQR